MRVAWFENPDNIVYVDVNEFTENFAKETGIGELRAKIEDFKKNPVKGGVILRGTKRTALKLFIPDLEFENHSLDMGDTVWIFIGETYPAYCLYWQQE